MKKMKSYKGYTATVEFDADEMLLHGRIDNIKDVVTFHAASVDQLRSQFQEAVDDYLDLCSERGEQPDKPYSGRFVVRLDPDQHRRVARSADSAGISLNRWIVEAVDAALNAAAERVASPDLSDVHQIASSARHAPPELAPKFSGSGPTTPKRDVAASRPKRRITKSKRAGAR